MDILIIKMHINKTYTIICQKEVNGNCFSNGTWCLEIRYWTHPVQILLYAFSFLKLLQN